MKAPRPGVEVRGSATGRPIMAALDLLGRRGTLRILWELRRGPLTFRALQEACGTNPGLLNTRLKEMRAVLLVTRAEGGYVLTPQGESLGRALSPLGRWADAWAASLDGIP